MRDIAFAIETCNISEDLLVAAGDNLLDFSLKGFVDYFEEKQSTCVMRYFEKDVERLSKTGVITLGDGDLVLNMQEKPKEPESNWAVPPFYIYHHRDLEKIIRAVEGGKCKTDAPGDLLAWLSGQKKIHAYEMPGERYDIGDTKSYLELRWK